MSKCDNCGRDDGHWLGCVAALREHARNLVEPDFSGSLWARSAELPDAEKVVTGTKDPICAFDDCEEPRRSADKRVKFCETHSDPKNRK
jgi:hypothetical protein